MRKGKRPFTDYRLSESDVFWVNDDLNSAIEHMRQKGGIPFEWDIATTKRTTEHTTSLTTKLVRKLCRNPSNESCFHCLSTEFPFPFTLNGLICSPWLRECSPVVVTDLGQDEFSGLSIVLLLVFLTIQTIERERLEVATWIDRTNVLSIGQTTTVIPPQDSYQQILQKTCESVSDHWFRQWMVRGRGCFAGFNKLITHW